MFFTSGITPYTTNTNTSFNIGKNTSEVIVVIKHAEATNLTSNLYRRENTRDIIAEGIEDWRISTSLSNPSMENNVEKITARIGAKPILIKSAKIPYLIPNFVELGDSDNPKDIIIRGTVALER